MTRCMFFRCRLRNLCPALTVVFTTWAQYSRYGGMPAVVALESEEEKRSRLTSFLKDACAADMVGQYGVGKTRELEALIRVVASCA